MIRLRHAIVECEVSGYKSPVSLLDAMKRSMPGVSMILRGDVIVVRELS